MPAASPSTALAEADPDAGLASRAAGGDAEAVATLLQKHQRRIYNLAFRSLNHAEDAADATQEALLKISRGIAGFRGHSRVSTWVTRIALNEACTVGRGRARRAGTAAEPPEAADRREQHREPAPERRLEAEEAADTLAAALAAVPEQFRVALILRDVDKLGYEAIAEVLDVPIGTVRSRIFRGRLALREILLAGDDAP
ncbi:RNA polymerase sigma factor [Phycisphaera mikurensis]|uniref:RNA polymerase ECF-type sigma factor n=1 Tax=Phycisphaera mikurensis (strain NBRC 102666 / KCTC 22515 / FYK2301M01) TaxID=1142394 RepID=I0IES1_PHYMF|nr:sigma-70 family RNA polymerase sigma factor [Phycisphaera mikurensis]MBB6441554.1 RNA polymerase sigma-70 factor (ECF subfamily) [Phycisphaera mikurensis]BAM03759.1 RNA polymerase ECF-type sigma factor [Phycisphaera mikurensis NBRC 102666]